MIFDVFKSPCLEIIYYLLFISNAPGPPQVARQSQLLRGVFPVLFHPLPAPVWADDVDGRVSFGMDIGELRLPALTRRGAQIKVRLTLAVLLRQSSRVLQVRGHGDRGDRMDPGLRTHQHHEGRQRPVSRTGEAPPTFWQQDH